jgi:hypothetical protein
VTNKEGVHHYLLMKSTILIPKGTLPFRLLSPQHFGQENFTSGLDSDRCGTLSVTSGLDNVLSWSDHKYCITTHLDPGSNIAIINADAGYSNFSAFMSQVEPPTEPVALLAPHMIPDNDEEVTSPQTNIDSDDPWVQNIPRTEGENEGGKMKEHCL